MDRRDERCSRPAVALNARGLGDLGTDRRRETIRRAPRSDRCGSIIALTCRTPSAVGTDHIQPSAYDSTSVCDVVGQVPARPRRHSPASAIVRRAVVVTSQTSSRARAARCGRCNRATRRPPPVRHRVILRLTPPLDRHAGARGLVRAEPLRAQPSSTCQPRAPSANGLNARFGAPPPHRVAGRADEPGPLDRRRRHRCASNNFAQLGGSETARRWRPRGRVIKLTRWPHDASRRDAAAPAGPPPSTRTSVTARRSRSARLVNVLDERSRYNSPSGPSAHLPRAPVLNDISELRSGTRLANRMSPCGASVITMPHASKHGAAVSGRTGRMTSEKAPINSSSLRGPTRTSTSLAPPGPVGLTFSGPNSEE